MAIRKKTVKYRVDGCACLDGWINIGECDDNNVYDMAGVPVPGAVVTPAGDCPTEVVVVCGNEPPPEPPPPPEPITIIGEDCEGAPVPVTGLPGEVTAVVQAPGTVFKVQLCDNAKDYEKVILCDSITEHKIAIITDFTDPTSPVVSYWDINAGAPWTGDVADLQTCPDTDTESDPQTVCADGVELVQWVVKKNGEPTGVVYYTTPMGLVATVDPAAVVTLGACPVAACEPTISSAFGDDLSTLLPGHSVAVMKPTCCAVAITTSAGVFMVPKGVGAYSTTDFNCPVTVDSISIVSGTCDEADVIVTTQSKG